MSARGRHRRAGAARSSLASALAPGATTLAVAARVVAAVATEGRSADAAFAVVSEAATERAAVRAIALGTLRWHLRLAPAVQELLRRPAAQLPPLVQALLVASAHQIEHSRNPPQSTVNLAVDAARALGYPQVAGLVNAVLRRFAAERAAILQRIDASTPARTAHPAWLVEALERDWPGHAAQMLAANNAHPPMSLRVDLGHGTAAAYVCELESAGIAAHVLDWCATAVVLERPMPVNRLPGFGAGRVSVQDAGAQLAAPLLDARGGMRVLDACAAPGGKTGHLLEHTPGLAALVAADHDAERLARVRENLERLRRSANCVVADLGAPGALEALGEPFDRILLDAPCSSSGVIRRHPDIKLLRRASDIPVLAATQLAILGACFGRLRPGGRLVYCTCSVLDAENDAVVAGFLAAMPTARALPWPAGVPRPPGAVAGRFGMQLLPGAAAGTDGFYYACLEKADGAGG